MKTYRGITFYDEYWYEYEYRLAKDEMDICLA